MPTKRQWYICSACKDKTRLPFKPVFNTPILCRNCFLLEKSREFVQNGPPADEEPRTKTVKPNPHFGAYTWR